MKLTLQLSPLRIELGASEENQEKVVPVKDKENRRTRKASLKPASPNYNTY